MTLQKRIVAVVAALCLMGMVGCGGSGGSGGSGGGNGDTDGGSPSGEDKAPVAGVEQVDIKTHMGTTVDLSAAPSTDENGDTLTYAWTLESAPEGSMAELSDPEVANPSFVPDKLGRYRFKLVVSDGKADSAPAYVTVVTGFVNDQELEFAYIPPGTFTMGSSSEYAADTETEHQVTLSKGFFMMTTEMTNKLFAFATGGVWGVLPPDAPPLPPGQGANDPKSSLRKTDISRVLDYLNAQGTGTYRLPTEAEWEYAARAGSHTDFYTGDLEEPGPGSEDLHLGAMGWYIVNSDLIKHEVAQKAPNAWWLYDMHGNMAELVSDLWDGSTPYGVIPVLDPVGMGAGTPVVRGGAYDQPPTVCRSAARQLAQDGATNTFYRENIGFRLVRELETAPVIDIGTDHTVVQGEPIKLDGLASYDPDGYPLSFAWTLVSAPEGNTAELKNADKAQATFQPNVPGYHTFELTVDDGHSEPVSKKLTVDVQLLKLVLFNSYTVSTGKMGGREGADQLVADSYWLPKEALQVHAFLSVTEKDCIKNMPANFGFSAGLPVFAQDGVTKIAENWADLLDGPLPAALKDLGDEGKGYGWWSGSKADGTLAANCNGWTQDSVTSSGMTGTSHTADGWIYYWDRPANETFIVLGIALQSYSVHSPDKLRLFSTKNKHYANAGGRKGVNALVRRDPNRPQGMPNAFGFISVNHEDCIKNMPALTGLPDDVPITGPDGETVIADNWADLLDGDIKVSLVDAGVIEDPEADRWWSGSRMSGEVYSGYNANGWTTFSTTVYARDGSPTSTTDTWIEGGTYRTDLSTYYLGIGF